MQNLQMLLIVFLFASANSQVTTKTLLSTLKHPPKTVNKRSILENHDKLDDFHNNYNEGNVRLAYVTPWNNHGYNLAKQTAHKLSHISPVWLQAKPNCKIEGIHDIDRNWINDLRVKNEKIKIVPRIIFEGWNRQEMQKLLDSPRKCAQKLADFYNRNEFDGAVIEIFLQSLMTIQSLQAKVYIIEAMEDVSKVFKKSNLEVIYTVPAPLDYKNQPNQLIEPIEFEKMIGFSDYVQVMTYDYRSDTISGVAPYNWVENNLNYLGNGENLLLGINFYGYEFTKEGVDAIKGKRFLEALAEKSSKYTFDESVMEHKLVTSKSTIYYPSLSSLELRINLARRGGIAIWDYGQGLDYFIDLI
ncbi:unnamed protein product [Caenorhabditis angaria]|uniref:GH18 domain-containing protein n=1 Tax=Caenorhabditis angaria TaxID=860376 RepID=A0A9P1IGV2_9PELO|nr:unnamed protein product [Caenorhabditis angaria]